MFGMSILWSKGVLVWGDTSWLFIHSSIESRSYVMPSEATTGSAMRLQRNDMSHNLSAAEVTGG